jgi:DNA-binding MarR family transcriptional regulator
MAHMPGADPAVEAARQRIRRIARLFERVLTQAAEAHGLSVGDWEALSVLQRCGPPHERLPKQIAAALRITSGTMSVRIDRLTRAGLVEPAPNSSLDGRSRPIRLTERGSALWRAATDQRIDQEHRILAGALDPDGLAVLNPLLAQLLARFEDEFGPAPSHGSLREA